MVTPGPVAVRAVPRVVLPVRAEFFAAVVLRGAVPDVAAPERAVLGRVCGDRARQLADDHEAVLLGAAHQRRRRERIHRRERRERAVRRPHSSPLTVHPRPVLHRVQLRLGALAVALRRSASSRIRRRRRRAIGGDRCRRKSGCVVGIVVSAGVPAGGSANALRYAPHGDEAFPLPIGAPAPNRFPPSSCASASGSVTR